MLKSTEMAEVINDYAAEISAEAGAGYEAETFTAQTRFVGRVNAVDQNAINDNAENNTLLKLIKKKYD